MILAIRTDQKESYIGLYDGKQITAETTWQAHRELSDTLLKTIESELNSVGKDWSDISGIVIFKGPGSFTGLRIGATVANTLANSQSVPIVGTNGDDWLESGIQRLQKAENDKIVTPEYGGEANITKPKK